MDQPSNRKVLLVPAEAGHVIMERYGLSCEVKSWSAPGIEEYADRIVSAHAPYEMRVKNTTCRINIASPIEKFRQYCLGVIEGFIRAGRPIAPRCRLIVLHPPPRFWNEQAGQACPIQAVGEYGLMIESLKRLSKLCAENNLLLVLENNRVRWNGVGDDEAFDRERYFGKLCECFASSAQEWAQVPADVDEPNFGLCFDTSHAVTYAHRLPEAARKGVVDLYVTLSGNRLWHVHWSDSILEGNKGRQDLHLTVGKGTIPRDLHSKIWNYPSATTYLFEHWTHEGDLAFETRYVERL